MRIALLSAAALAVSLVATAGSAEAAQGCGPGFHRGFYGYCRPIFGPPRFAYRPYAYRSGFYGPRRHAWYGPRWHRW